MPLFFLGTREWRNRQTRTVQVRVPVMEWGFNSPLAHDETADPFGICGFCFPWLLLAAPWVFRAPRVLCEAGLLAGPGRCVCRWVAARPLAVRAASFARRVASKPGQALPPPRAPQPGPVPRSVPCPQFRMQFPDTCSSSLSEKPGISTIIFQSMKCARGNCMRVFGVAGTLIPAGRAAGTREPGWPVV